MDTKIDNYKKGFKIIVEDNWVRIQPQHGMLLGADLLLSTLEELHSMESYKNEKIISLWDLRGCSTDLDFEKMNTVKTYLESHYDKSWAHRITAVVVDHPFCDDLMRMYEMIADKITTTILIFIDIDQAENWLKEEINKSDNCDLMSVSASHIPYEASMVN
jgi:hypothetical protein